MHQNTLALFLLAFLCLQTKSLPLFLKAHSASSGIVELKKDFSSASAFYAEAELVSSSGGTSDTVRMAVIISNAETMVATNCLFFSSYDCNKYSCKNESKTTTIDFPTFTANVSSTQGQIRLNDTDLKLSSLYLADSCKTGDTFSEIGTNRYGVLGLASQNSPIFSFLIDPHQTNGQLLFKNIKSSSSPLYSLSANSTWQLPAKNGAIQVENSSISFNGNVMFDINSDAIGLPESIHKSFMNYFSNMDDVDCEIRDYKPKCHTRKQLKDLPDIILSVNGHLIKIPSQIYTIFMADTETERFFLLGFKATSPSLNVNSYISPSFKDSIVLGANFMNYYYTVFDASSGSNMIYLYSSTETPSQPSNAKWIVLGVVAALLVASICFWAKKRISKTSTPDSFNTPQTLNAAEYVPPAHSASFKEMAKP